MAFGVCRCHIGPAAAVRRRGRTPRVAARAARESAGNGTSTTAPGAQPDGPLASKNDPTVPTDESVYVCDDICSTATYGEAEMTEEAAEAQAKSDLFKAIAVGTGLGVTAGILDQPWVVSHEALTMSIVFAIGYVGIILEEEVSFNKSGVALVMAVALWTIAALGLPDGEVHAALSEKLSEVGEIVFFLIGAMTIVETVDAHQGFKVVTDAIKTRDRRALLWSIGTITFFMSAILDNLTSTIVMISLLRKLVPDADVRKVYGAAVVLAANAGGAWTPIGDVTTTMLWINGQITTGPTMRDLVLPSLASAALPLALMSFFTKEVQGTLPEDAAAASPQLAPRGKLVLASGIGALLFVPVFKSLTGLPPYLGMLAGLGALWLLTDAIHFGEEDRESLRVSNALSRIDSQGALFFLGILMSIGALDSMGILKDLARFMDAHIPSQEIIAAAIGLASAVIDNVPLVAATMGMYDISQHPVDSDLWQLIAYCAGTGGSILVIGSAAGVAFMGLEKVDFMWYVRKVSPWALAGYVGGMGVYLAQSGLHIPITSAFQQMLPHLS
ncbi:unnamed protein product [Pedinophyceae sp. YPF-701]|nr:unnamed protein product [Pedinophyceae sp. YPF-701]